MQSRHVIRALVLFAAASGPAALVADDNKATPKEAFMKAFTGPDSHQAGLAVKGLNPDNVSDYELLKMVLDKGSWYLRGIAATRLQKTGNPQNVKDMTKRLSDKEEPKALVRQGMATAIAKMNDRTLYPELFKALADKDVRVRREAAYSLRFHKDKGSIEALIKRWKDEKDPRVANYIRESLEDITKNFKGPNPLDWELWWAKVKDTFKIAETDEEAQAYADEAKKAEEEGNKLAEGKTASRDVDLTYSSRGTGTPVLVIPHYGQSAQMMVPFFIEIEKIARVSYMDVPDIKKFRNLPSKGAKNTPYYPIDPLVEAFEDFRKATKYDRVAIIACGLDAWIAMRYATKYPKNVAALIYVSPYSSQSEYGKTTDRMVSEGQSRNDIELWHLGLTRRVNTSTGVDEHDKYHKDQNLPKPEGEDGSLSRKDFTIQFGDQQDSLVDQLYPISYSPTGDCLIPDFKVDTEASGVPTMVCYGTKSIYASPADCEAVAKHYGAIVVAFDKSADLPFIEESQKFSDVVRQFLAKYVDKKGKK